ncbi:MAG: hypothetical protein Q9187_007491, partial [Circinaria calcarea]
MLISKCRHLICSRGVSAQYRLHQRQSSSALLTRPTRRSLLTLAIETSCDDTSVAILEKYDSSPQSSVQPSFRPSACLHFNEKVTADNSQFRGVHPLVSLDSHQTNLGELVNKALITLPAPSEPASPVITIRLPGHAPILKRKPDFISVTRGPGMRSSLSTGIDTAKGLAVAWQIPLVGVNHMQAHALTPRLVSALEPTAPSTPAQPSFPFLSLLVSGGHTLLVHSQSLTTHRILAKTSNIAIGDALDKIARSVLPSDILSTSGEIMYGRLLEDLVFPPEKDRQYAYSAPLRRADELERKMTRWGWGLGIPLAETRSGSKSKSMEFSFTGLETSCRRIMSNKSGEIDVEERRELGKEAMRVAFEHLASRVVMALQTMKTNSTSKKEIDTLVISGGVASNGFLKT